MAEAEYEIDGEWFNDHEMMRLEEYAGAPQALGRPYGELIRANERTDIRLALQGCITIHAASKTKQYVATEKGREHLAIWGAQYESRRKQEALPQVDGRHALVQMQEEIDRLTAERAERDETIRKQGELIAQMVDAMKDIQSITTTNITCAPIIQTGAMREDQTDGE
jgi:hypothetical protein